MMSKTAVQKQTDYRSSLRGAATSFGGGLAPPPSPSLVMSLVVPALSIRDSAAGLWYMYQSEIYIYSSVVG